MLLPQAQIYSYYKHSPILNFYLKFYCYFYYIENKGNINLKDLILLEGVMKKIIIFGLFIISLYTLHASEGQTGSSSESSENTLGEAKDVAVYYYKLYQYYLDKYKKVRGRWERLAVDHNNLKKDYHKLLYGDGKKLYLDILQRYENLEKEHESLKQRYAKTLQKAPTRDVEIEESLRKEIRAYQKMIEERDNRIKQQQQQLKFLESQKNAFANALEEAKRRLQLQ